MLQKRWVPLFLFLLVGGLACRELIAITDDTDEEESQPQGRRGGRRRRNRNRNRRGAEGVVVPPVVTPLPQGPVAPVVNTLPTPNGPTRLRVVFLNIGQGDAALLQSGDGHNALIDAGPPEGREHLRQALAARGVTTLDWMMLSHPHLDHIGGAQQTLQTVTVQRVIDPSFPHPIATYNRLLEQVQARSIPFSVARSNATLSLGAGVSVELLLPHEPFLQNTRSDPNANSIVARVLAGGVRVLFTGDAERETEERLLAEQSTRLSAQVLKVAHHGSRFASTPAFLQAVAPSHAVISCGAGNEYGHPHAETLQALSQRGVQVFRTDQQGDIELTTDGVGVRMATTTIQ